MQKIRSKINFFLRKNGIKHLTGFNVPAELFAVISILSLILVTATIRNIWSVSGILLIIVMVLSLMLPAFVLIVSNSSDNADMLSDIHRLFEMLKIQLHGGVYIIDALENCCLMIKNKRLRYGISKLVSDVYVSGDSDKALDEFNLSFNNEHIDTLVILLKQSMETGTAVLGLESAFEQIGDVEHAIYIKKENSVERRVQVLQVFIMAGIIAIAIYCSLVEFKGLFEIF